MTAQASAQVGDRLVSASAETRSGSVGSGSRPQGPTDCHFLRPDAVGASSLGRPPSAANGARSRAALARRCALTERTPCRVRNEHLDLVGRSVDQRSSFVGAGANASGLPESLLPAFL